MSPSQQQTMQRRYEPPVTAFKVGGSGEAQSGARRALRIIVADDDPDTVNTLLVVLQDEGHEAVGVLDGGALLRETRKSKPDAVILDIGMPGLTGYDLARALRASYGGDCPMLIAVTAYATTVDKLIGKDAGFDYHFGKPVLIDDLLAALSRVKGRHAARTEGTTIGEESPSWHADLFIARKSCRQIREAVILSRTLDDEWLQQIRKAASTADAAINDAECKALLISILNFAGDLRSPEQAGKWARPRGMTGANYLKLQIICKLSLLQQRLSEIEAMRLATDRLVSRLSGPPKSL